MLRPAACASTLFALAAVFSGQEGDWPQFRGPSGVAVGGAAALPASFGPEENLLWKTSLPPGHSSPCIVGSRIFLTGFAEEKNVLLAIDRANGKVLWKKTYEGPPHPDYFHPDAVPALPTPVSDGESVIASFANYGLVAVDLDGEPLWEKRLPPPGYVFGMGASPLLVEGLLVVARDGAPEAGILVLDAADGSELWRIDRFDYQEAHGTPFLWRNADRDELVIVGTNRLNSYDLGTGEVLWYVDDMTNFPCTTPTADEDTLYFAGWSTPNATGRSFWEAGFTWALELSDEEIADPALLFARLDADEDGKVVRDEVPESRFKDAFGFLDTNGSGAWEVEELLAANSMGSSSGAGRNIMVAVARGAEGDAAKEHVRWTWTRGLPYVASPLLYEGRIWLFKSGGIATCLDAATGEPVFDRERLSERCEYYSSPVGAGGRVLVGSAKGTLYVLDAKADELAIEHTVAFEEDLFATPAVLDGTIYVRTKETLWAFGGEAKE